MCIEIKQVNNNANILVFYYLKLEVKEFWNPYVYPLPLFNETF